MFSFFSCTLGSCHKLLPRYIFSKTLPFDVFELIHMLCQNMRDILITRVSYTKFHVQVRYEEELRDGGVHLRNAKFLIKLLGEQLHRVMILRAAAGNEARYFEEISNLLRSVQDCADKYTRSLRLG